ncbi:hypothetical protein BS17DRAFT_772413 [Gyrodon lividus]|nr:hypothetical protein BS17DRAFT_772413 [Gyrodon lividus]
MNRPLPALPKRYDLVESFNALAVAGKEDDGKKLPDPPVSNPDHDSSFIGGFSPERLALNALLDSHRRPPLMPPAVSGRAAVPAPPLRTPSRSPFISMPIPEVSKQSLTMQHALNSMGPNTPAKAALALPLVTPPSRPHSGPLLSPTAMAQPSISASSGPPHPVLNVTPSRPRASSVPPSPAISSPRSSTTQCSGMTKAGKQCSRQVRLPPVHCHLDPIPALYCHQHKEVMITAQTGFYVRRPGQADRFVEFGDYIPRYLQTDTQLALRVEMEKAPASADVPGYIYTFEIRDPKRPTMIQLKVGRAVNLNKRLDQWDKQCESKVQIPRGWWPGTVEGEDDSTSTSLLKGNIKAGEPGPFCHRVERLVHIELADLSVHAPYLEPGWPKFDTSDASPSAASVSSSPSSKKAAAKACPHCGVAHKEIFAFPRPDKGRYKGREWDLIVKPVIEKWGKFMKEYYA